jgi:type IV secretion system protein VirB9
MKYPLHTLWVLIVALLFSGGVHAVQKPSPGVADSRVREVRYDPKNVVSIVGYVGITTQVFLNEDEKILRLGPPGNKEAWEVHERVGDVATFTVRPIPERGEVASTNLLVQTSERFYMFELVLGKNEGQAKKPVAPDMMFAVFFRYDDTANGAPGLLRKAAGAIPEAPVSGPQIIHAYKGRGKSALAPFAIYDDGRFTYMRFTAQQGAPAVYYLDVNGEPGIPNRHVVRDQVTGHRIAVYHGVWSKLRVHYSETTFYCLERVDPIRSLPPQPTGVPLHGGDKARRKL